MPKPVKVKAKMGRPPKDVVGLSASQKRVKKLNWNVTNIKMKLEDLKKENASPDEIIQAEEDLKKAEDALQIGLKDKQDAMNRKSLGLGVTGESSGVAKKQIAVVSPRVRLEEVFETEDDDDDDDDEIEGTEMAGGDSTEEQIVLAINIKSVIMHFMLMLLLVCLWFLL